MPIAVTSNGRRRKILKLHAKLPKDDVGAELMRFEGIRGQRYTEIFIIGGNAPFHLSAASTTRSG